MFQTAICDVCSEEFIKKTYTQSTCSSKECRRSKKNPGKPLAPIGKRTKERLLENWPMNTFFIQEVWDKREHRCEICHTHIPEPLAVCFSHILSRGRYPSLAYKPNNIRLVCSEFCHKENDFINKGNDIFLMKEILWGWQ